MRTFGQEIIRLRERSQYPHPQDFALRAGLSARGLKYIESDQRLPGVATLEKLLTAVAPSLFEAERLRRLRAEAQARRDGFALPKRDAHQLPRLVGRVGAEVTFFLRKRGVDLGRRDVDRLHRLVEDTVRDVMDPAGAGG